MADYPCVELARYRELTTVPARLAHRVCPTPPVLVTSVVPPGYVHRQTARPARLIALPVDPEIPAVLTARHVLQVLGAYNNEIIRSNVVVVNRASTAQAPAD